MKTKHVTKLWGSAFDQTPSEAVVAFAAGRDMAGVQASDTKLIPYDLWLNQAHVLMLAKQSIIPVSDAVGLLKGLEMIHAFAEKGKFLLSPGHEDVHTAIEGTLTQMLGTAVAGKLHTARSRNDQVATDMRLYMRDQAIGMVGGILVLADELLFQAEKHKGTVMPGFTLHQHAMVTTWGHTLAAWVSMILRDAKRLTHWLDLHNTCPLGSSVAYGTSFPIDSTYTAKLLGFDGPEGNSLDSITNRWEAEADLVFAISVLMNHLSGLAETIILLSTPEFGMLMVADAYSTGSSIMPQKKNPDTLEVIKGKASYVTGQLMGLMGLGKENFMGYNRDSQWAKYLVMDVVDESLNAPFVVRGIIETLTVHKERMEAWCHEGFIGSASLMEHIVKTYHLPMREGKIIVEKAVKYSKRADCVTHAGLMKALLEGKYTFSITPKKVKDWQDPAKIIAATQSFGGPGQEAIIEAIETLKGEAIRLSDWLGVQNQQKEKALTLLDEEIGKLQTKGAL